MTILSIPICIATKNVGLQRGRKRGWKKRKVRAKSAAAVIQYHFKTSGAELILIAQRKRVRRTWTHRCAGIPFILKRNCASLVRIVYASRKSAAASRAARATRNLQRRAEIARQSSAITQLTPSIDATRASILTGKSFQKNYGQRIRQSSYMLCLLLQVGVQLEYEYDCLCLKKMAINEICICFCDVQVTSF